MPTDTEYPPDVIALAMLQAAADGDWASVARLREMGEDPETFSATNEESLFSEFFAADAPPGTHPPFPGAQYDKQIHHWVKPDTGEATHDHEGKPVAPGSVPNAKHGGKEGVAEAPKAAGPAKPAVDLNKPQTGEVGAKPGGETKASGADPKVIGKLKGEYVGPHDEKRADALFSPDEVKELASELGVHPDEIQKALKAIAGKGAIASTHPAAQPAAKPTPPSPQSQGEFQVSGNDPAKTKQILGADLHPDRLAQMANAQPGSKTTVAYRRAHTHSGVRDVVAVSNKGEGYYTLRQFYRDDDGKLVARNSEFFIDRGNAKDLPRGTEMLAKQIEALKRAGVSRIETCAAGDPRDPDNVANGYYTWPRLGYDGEVPRDVWERMPPEVREKANPKGTSEGSSVRALMADDSTREWWKKNGKTFRAKFDLSDDSPNMIALAEYRASKGK